MSIQAQVDSIRLFGANTIQVLVRAQQQLAGADCRGCVGTAVVVFELVVREQFKLWLSRDHKCTVTLRNVIQFSISQYRRRPDRPRTRLQPLFINHLAGCWILAANDVAVTRPVKMAFVVNWRRDVGTFVKPPKAVRFGNVATAARAYGQRRVATANDVNHVVTVVGVKESGNEPKKAGCECYAMGIIGF